MTGDDPLAQGRMSQGHMSQARMSLWPLFLISGAAVGFEIALTRYFAVAKWSEYGYWVISIVMVGFALSGVTIALARDWAARHGPRLLRAAPPVLVLAAAGGYWGTTANPFNPLQLQNAVTFLPQLGNIALYYAVLLPFFYLTGLYISITFVLNEDRVGRVYGFDLTGAGAGAALVLGLMALLHPFQLVAALLVLLAATGLFGARPWRTAAAALAALVASEAVLLLDNLADYNDFKAIYAPAHVTDAKQIAELRSPRGLYALLDDFTERVDTDVSNNAEMVGAASPPRSYGLYRDGNRIAALPLAEGAKAAYAPAALDALPYRLLPGARVLIAGSSGGFRVAQALALHAGTVDVLEPDPVILGALRNGLGPSPALARDPRVRLLPDSPLAAVRGGASYDLVDLSADFLDAGEANAAAYTAEAMERYLHALAPGGLVSIPVSIREFPVYAVRVLGTVREALRRAGASDPAAHVVVYRSAWNLRILVANQPWTAERIAAVRSFCDERSFDVSYYPGMDVAAARAGIYNDLPAVNFTSGEVTSGAGSEDAVADEAGAVLRGEPSESQDAFNLSPITLDRPFYYSVLRLTELPTILKRVEMLPQAEVGQLVNLAVLAQAVVIALIVLAVPLFSSGITGRQARGVGMLRPVVYFASLGLGFLFIEIFLIEKASLYLNDRTSAFALVLTGMLVFSGLGSLLADRVRSTGIALSAAVVVAWCILVLIGLEPVLLATLGLPWVARAGLVLLLIAPVSLALGLPFPLGLARAGSAGGGFLPWAWGLNGAFSVVATPLANLVAVQLGFSWVLMAAACLYVLTYVAYPSLRKNPQWQPIPST
jgi:spermidine synthase